MIAGLPFAVVMNLFSVPVVPVLLGPGCRVAAFAVRDDGHAAAGERVRGDGGDGARNDRQLHIALRKGHAADALAAGGHHHLLGCDAVEGLGVDPGQVGGQGQYVGGLCEDNQEVIFGAVQRGNAECRTQRPPSPFAAE